MSENAPILEFDAAKTAVFEPAAERLNLNLPTHCVLCFFPDVLTKLANEGQLVHIGDMYCEMGNNPVYLLTTEARTLAVAHPGVGGPLAAYFLEVLIANGCHSFIACGGAGVLQADLNVGALVVPNTAVRDEGTSYHYLPASREVAATAVAVQAIENTLTRKNIPYVVGKTWTTDAIFRETRNKVSRRQAEGCLTVEMESATFFAVAQFRNVTFGQILYGGDDLTGVEWDERNWIQQPTLREKLFWLAVDACLALEDTGQSES
jgi:uridine phosphorylase